MSSTNQLKRSISLTGLIFYGTGTMIGGGIYALLGKVTEESGLFAPWSMLIAGLTALITALSFAELSSRFPQSGGSAYYISQAWNNKTIGSIFGWLIIATGVVSSATLTVAASRFLFDLFSLPLPVGEIIVAIILCGIACWGITQSVFIVALVTLIEIAGLLFVILFNNELFNNPQISLGQMLPVSEMTIWLGIFSGTILAFYAFIGFEDMVTLAEEAKNAKRNLPISIIVSIVITISLYILVSYVAVQSGKNLSDGDTHSPMASLVEGSKLLSPTALIVISLLAGFNGALVQVVMASRMLFGMAKESQAPTVFGSVYSKTQTPVNATIFAAMIVLILAMTMELTTLAKLTSAIILFVFAAVNFSLFRIKLKPETSEHFSVPILLPAFGATISILMFGLAVWLGVTH